jgi:hypothetical protein
MARDNEQCVSNLWCDPGGGGTCVRCGASSCPFVAPALTAAATRSLTESGVIGEAGVRCARVCRLAEIHSYVGKRINQQKLAAPTCVATSIIFNSALYFVEGFFVPQ